MRFGICGSTVVRDSSGVELIERAREIGYDYLELSLSHTSALSEEAFEALSARVRASGMPCEACNNFFPPTVRLTGPKVSRATVEGYTKMALDRAVSVGARVVVFGSSGARNVPAGFPMDEALRQIAETLRFVADQAAPRGLLIAIEPLNRQESNIINTLAEALSLMRTVDRPEVRVLADYYHFALERETPGALLRAGSMIRHVHVARVEGRTYLQDHDPGLLDFYMLLSAVGYNARISVEGAPTDFDKDAARSLRILRELEGAARS